MTAPLTDEERRILKTMAGVRNQTLIATLEKRAERPAWVLRLCEHELARREAERAKGDKP